MYFGLYGPLYKMSPKTSAGEGQGREGQDINPMTTAASCDPVRLFYKMMGTLENRKVINVAIYAQVARPEL